MNVELKDLQIIFYEKEIAVFFPSWYHTIVERMQIISSEEVQPKHYGIANKDGQLYVLVNKIDAENLAINVIVEEPQIEHMKPKHFL